MADSNLITAGPLAKYTFNSPESDPQAARLINFTRILGRDDQGRATSQVVTMVATSAFTVVQSDPNGLLAERVIHVGEEFQISAYDLSRYAGRGRVKPAP